MRRRGILRFLTPYLNLIVRICKLKEHNTVYRARLTPVNG